MASDAPEPFPDTTLQPRRFSVVSQTVLDRDRVTVWDEYVKLHHPAWADQPEGAAPVSRWATCAG